MPRILRLTLERRLAIILRAVSNTEGIRLPVMSGIQMVNVSDSRIVT